jgi:DNA-binding beta-propeller fold protein YncE
MRESAVSSRSMRARRVKRRVLLCGLVASVGLLASVSSASALSQRGHVLAGSFGQIGSGAGELQDPQGVAVNEQTGDIYVVDAGNARVDRFDSSGKFISAFGIGVLNGERKPQVCTSTCLPGKAANGKGDVFGARGIAIDSSTNSEDPSQGDVYVEISPFETEEGGKEFEREGAIEKFTAEGVPVEKGPQISTFKVLKENFNTKKIEPVTEEIEEPHGIYVDPAGTLYLYDEETVVKFSDEAPNKTISTVEAEPEEAAFGLVVDTHGNLYLGNETETGKPPEISEFPPSGGEALVEAIYDQPTSAIAYEAGRGDFLLDNETSVAVLSADKDLVETLGSGTLTKGTGVAANEASGHIYVADAATGKITDFAPEPPGAISFGELSATGTTPTSTELRAEVNPAGVQGLTYTFRISTGQIPGPTEPCNAPCVEGPSPAAALGSEGFDIVQTPPELVNGLTPQTKYHYAVLVRGTVEEGGTAVTKTAESPEHFVTTPFEFGSTLPDGRSYEQVSPPKKDGAAIQPMPTEGGVIQASADGSAITYLSAGAISNTEGNPEPEGNHAPNLTQNVGRWTKSGWSSHDIDVRHDAGEGITPGEGNNYELFSSELGLASLRPFGSEKLEHPPLDGDPAQEHTPYLRDNAPECMQSPAPTTCFIPLASAANASQPFGFPARVGFAGASADLHHDVIESTVALTSTAVPVGTSLYERSDEAPGTLELVSVLPDEQPATNAVLGYKTGTVRQVEHAVSEDGSLVAFSVIGTLGPEHLYVHDSALHKTVQVDAQQPGFEVPKSIFPNAQNTYEKPYFDGASADGSMVYFTDQWRLTPDATSTPENPDLYACHVVVTEGHLECRLKDLTVDSAAEQANVQGVLGNGASQSGNTIYYVANGKMAEGARVARCKASLAEAAKETEESEPGLPEEAHPANGICNLYAQHYNAATETWSLPKLVSLVSQEDEPDWATFGDSIAGHRGNLRSLSSRVSPDGERLAFMSDRNLARYEPRDPATGRNDEEVYSYDNASSSIVCASCDPSGAPPHGVFDIENSGEGIGLLVDRARTWLQRRLSGMIPGWTAWELNSAFYQSRYLSDEGRLFFDSAEALVPQDKNGKEDVYEYEPLGLGGCTEAAETFHPDRGGCVSLVSSGTSSQESAFIDASTNGNDAFFVTNAPLVEQDKDGSYDVYDAAVCGREGTRECVEPPAATKVTCTEIKTCRGEAGETEPGPVFAPPASTSAAPDGNTGKHEVLGTKEESKTTTKAKAKPLTRAQKLAKALKACHKIRDHKKRLSCERTAHKHFGPVKKHAKKARRSTTAAGRGR